MLITGPMIRGALCWLFVVALLSPGAAHSAAGQGEAAPPPLAPVEFQLFMHRARADVPPAFLGFTIDWNNATLDSSWAGADLVEIDLGYPPLLPPSPPPPPISSLFPFPFCFFFSTFSYLPAFSNFSSQPSSSSSPPAS